MRGDQIGALSIGNAYNRSVTLTFSNSSNQGMFSTLKAILPRATAYSSSM